MYTNGQQDYALDWQTYQTMKAKVDNALAFDPLYETTQAEIVASTRLALQKKQNAAIGKLYDENVAWHKTKNYFSQHSCWC